MGRLLEEDDVVDWLLKRTEMYDATGHFVDENVVKKNIESQIAKIPSAQTERKIGHWIEIALSHHSYKCSVCGRLLVNITDGKDNVTKNYPYCHCGADMRGE